MKIFIALLIWQNFGKIRWKIEISCKTLLLDFNATTDTTKWWNKNRKMIWSKTLSCIPNGSFKKIEFSNFYIDALKCFLLKSVGKKMQNKVFISINPHFFSHFLSNWFHIKTFLSKIFFFENSIFFLQK